MKSKKTSMPAASFTRMTQAQKERLVTVMIRDAIHDLMTARVVLSEGGWDNTTDLLTAMTLTRFGQLHAAAARQWMWRFAQERGATKRDLLAVRSTPELTERILKAQAKKKARRGGGPA